MQKLILSLGLLLGSLIGFAQSNNSNFQGFKYVKDEAHLLAKTDAEKLEIRLQNYEDSTSNEIAIFTLNSLNGQNLEDFSNDLARKHHIGKKDKNNGILILVCLKERKLHIEVGYGLESRIPDLAAKQIIDNQLKPNFKNQQYAQGLNEALDRIIDLTKGEFKANADSNSNSDTNSTNEKPANSDDGTNTLIGFGVLGGGIVAGGIWWSRSARRRRKRQTKEFYNRLVDELQTMDWDLVKKYYQAESVEAQKQDWETRLISIGSEPKNWEELKGLNNELKILDDIKQGNLYGLKDYKLLKIKEIFALQNLVNQIQKNQTFYQSPFFNQANVQTEFQKLAEEANYFENKSILSEEDKTRLQNSVNHFQILFEKPEQILGYNRKYLKDEIDKVYNKISWIKYIKHPYTPTSINATQATFEKKYNALEADKDGKLMYDFYVNYLLVLQQNPGNFLEPLYGNSNTYSSDSGTTYSGGTTIITNSYSDSNSSYSDTTSTYSDYKDYSDYSDSYSDSSSSYSDSSFGGGDFGGGGASGDW